MDAISSKPYWLKVPALSGSREDPPRSGQICIIGSGLAGISAAYWLLKFGFDQIVIIDEEAETSASFRNCGHILHGTVESMHALAAVHGESKAKSIWQFSIEICDEVKETIHRHQIEAEYKQDGYLVIAIDESEDAEIRASVDLLNRLGFQSDYLSQQDVEKLGFQNVYGARYEAGSAQAHPTKFRNGILREVLKHNVHYHSGVKVCAVDDVKSQVHVQTEKHGTLIYDAAVIATNAYSPLLSHFFRSRQLIDPFRGQIICSQPLKHKFPIRYPHSFDHGYEYAIVTTDNRLMIGGWRHHTPNGETGTYDLSVNPMVVQGLAEFARRHYKIDDELKWEHSWAGIMASSKTGFPFIGPTDSPLIFTVSGFTGHGFSWAHGSAKLLAKIMAGEKIPEVAKYFNPVIR